MQDFKYSNQEVFDRWIKPFSDAKGPSGFEHEPAKLALELASPYGKTQRDLMQNVYVERHANKSKLGERGDRPVRVQLDAHLDEVGFMVQHILPNGCLAVMPLGGWIAHNVPAHEFRVLNGRGEWVYALSASKPPHFMNAAERQAAISLDSIVLDVGARSAEEAKSAFGLEEGMPVVPEVISHYESQHDLAVGKAFDCRIGCASLTLTLDLLAGVDLSCDLVAGFSSQEEVGLRGARVTSRKIEPDLAIVFEGTPADDTFTEPARIQTAIGSGPMLRYLDNSMVTQPAWQRLALQTAKEQDIPVQAAVRSGGGTNGGSIHLSNQGVPTVVIAIPVRYIHTHYGFAKVQDVQYASLLASHLLRKVDRDLLEALKDLRF